MLKKGLLILGALGILPLLAACNMTLEQAWDYNDRVIEVLNDATHTYDDYSTYATETELKFIDKIEEKRITTLALEEEYSKKLEEIGAYGEEKELIEAAKKSVNLNVELLKNEEKELIELWKEEVGETEEEGKIREEKQNTILDSIAKKIEEDEKQIAQAQEDFAKKHGFNIEEEK